MDRARGDFPQVGYRVREVVSPLHQVPYDEESLFRLCECIYEVGEGKHCYYIIPLTLRLLWRARGGFVLTHCGGVHHPLQGLEVGFFQGAHLYPEYAF